jgi:hypothetical protein
LKRQKPDWIHARVPGDKQKLLKELLKRGYNKTDLALDGVMNACKKEGLVPA